MLEHNSTVLHSPITAQHNNSLVVLSSNNKQERSAPQFEVENQLRIEAHCTACGVMKGGQNAHARVGERLVNNIKEGLQLQWLVWQRPSHMS